MKTVTADFLDAQKAVAPRMQRTLSYKRRYWDETTKTYIWESSWTEMDLGDVQNISAVTWQLDSERLSEFKVSNVTLILKNDDNRWMQTNSAGKFAGDTTSPIGYEAYWTKFKIEAGFELFDESVEQLTIFTGLATDWVFDSDTGLAKANVQGLESLLINANAEEVSTSVAEETLTGTVNGVNKVFTTAHLGVGIVYFVSDNGTNLKQGTDYDVSNLNEPALPATITFVVAPLVAHTIRAKYIYWFQDTAVKTLIDSLLDAANIETADRNVEDVILASITSNQFLVSTQAQWEAGTFDSMEAAVSPGDLTFNYASAAFRTLQNDFASGLQSWVAFPYSATSPVVESHPSNVANVAGQMELTTYQHDHRPTFAVLQTFTGGATYSTVRAAGTFEAKITSAALTAGMRFIFMAQSITQSVQVVTGGVNFHTYTMKPLNAYALSITDIGLSLVRYSSIGVATILASVAITPGSTQHTYKVVRHPSNGKMDVYYDGVLKFTVFDTMFNSSAVMAFTGNGDVDDIYTAPATVTGSWVSAEQDATAALNAWGLVNATYTLTTGATLTFSTKSSTVSGSGYEAYTEVIIGHRIESGVKRYLVAKIEVTAPTDGTVTMVNDLTLGYFLNDVFKNTSLANYTGQTVYEAIQNYGRFADYEFGFTPDEIFFFRSRKTGVAAQFALRHDTNVLKIVSQSNGYERVYSEVQATYGNYSRIISADTQSRGSPVLRFGARRLDVDGANILIDEDDDVATGIATELFNRYKKPKRRYKLQTIMLPQLDLADVVSLNYEDVSSPKQWYWGDTSVHYGENDIHYYGKGQQLAANVMAKVIGIRMDTENWQCEIDLEEVVL